MIPDVLYQLTDYEVTKADWAPQRVTARAQVDLNAMTLTRRFGPVPANRVLLLTSASMLAAGGGAQTVSTGDISILGIGAADTMGLVAIHAPVTATGALNWVGRALLMPGEQLSFLQVFSAGALVNQLIVGFNGLLIPVASFQHGSLGSF